MSEPTVTCENWREHWLRKTAKGRFAMYEAWKARVNTDEMNAVLKEMALDLREIARRILDISQRECPLAFWIPSYDQAQILNAWSPTFEPEIAPNGYTSMGIFCANRIGKTEACVVNMLLWILPADKTWKMFQERDDPFGRGKYKVIQRPDWEFWKRRGIYKLPIPGHAAKHDPVEIWHGVPDDTFWHDIVEKIYRKLVTPSMILKVKKEEAWYKSEKSFTLRNGHSVKGKSYMSQTQAWAGKAVWGITLDEGLDRAIMDEAMLRLQSGGYFSWAYTPAEARNVGSRTKLAHDCFKGKYPLPGKVKFFTDMSMANAPEWIIPKDKKEDDMKRLATMGEQGRARMMGGFFESSPVVFSHFERDFHVLPMDGLDVLSKWPDANLIRGFDEGIAHPTAVCWVAILRSGEYVVYREYCKTGLSIGERCKQIIDLSGNRREVSQMNSDPGRTKYVEVVVREKIRRTFADSKMFKRDPNNVADDWVENYRRAGLKLERAGNIGPAARCDYTNGMFSKDHTRKHLMSNTAPGCRLYVTRDCVELIERLQEYLWQQIRVGARAGEFTGRPEETGDDLLDAACYPACSKLKWHEAGNMEENENRRYLVDKVTGYAYR